MDFDDDAEARISDLLDDYERVLRSRAEDHARAVGANSVSARFIDFVSVGLYRRARLTPLVHSVLLGVAGGLMTSGVVAILADDDPGFLLICGTSVAGAVFVVGLLILISATARR